MRYILAGILAMGLLLAVRSCQAGTLTIVPKFDAEFWDLMKQENSPASLNANQQMESGERYDAYQDTQERLERLERQHKEDSDE